MIAREERTAGIRERRVRFSVEAPKALPGYSLRGHRLKSLLSFSPFPPIIHPPPRPAPLYEATKMNRPLCLSKVWENSNFWHCIAYFFFSLSLSLSLCSRDEKNRVLELDGGAIFNLIFTLETRSTVVRVNGSADGAFLSSRDCGRKCEGVRLVGNCNIVGRNDLITNVITGNGRNTAKTVPMTIKSEMKRIKQKIVDSFRWNNFAKGELHVSFWSTKLLPWQSINLFLFFLFRKWFYTTRQVEDTFFSKNCKISNPRKGIEKIFSIPNPPRSFFVQRPLEKLAVQFSFGQFKYNIRR